MRRRLRIVVGLMAWTAVAAVTGWLVNDQADKALGQRVAPQLWRYASGSRSTVPLQLSDQLDLRGGDPIFFSHDDGRLVQIGEIRYTAGQQAPTALLYSSAPTPTSTNQLAWYSSPNSMAWIVSTLMPEAKQRQVSAQIRQAVEKLFAQSKVKVAKVNTARVPGKTKRSRTTQAGKTSDWKKAVVTLKEGKIEY